MIDLLQRDPIAFALRFVALMLSLVAHEWAHAYASYRMGDNTARDMGRLSFNPLRHIDWLGAGLLLLFGFGWAKPVQIDSRYYKNKKMGIITVSLAGIAFNIVLFVLGASLMLLVANQLFVKEMIDNFGLRTLTSLYAQGGSSYTMMLAEGSELITSNGLLYVQKFLIQLCYVNASLAFFNLLPIPPLDGSHVVNELLFKGRLNNNRQIASAMFMLLFAVSRFTDLLGTYIVFMGDKLQNLVYLLMGV